MVRHRSLNLKTFIDTVPDSLLQEYFRKKLDGTDMQAPSGLSYGAIERYLEGSDNEELEARVREDFRTINDICEITMNVVVLAYHYFGIHMDEDKSKEELALKLFLHHQEAFEYAYDFYCLYNSATKMSDHKIGVREVIVDQSKIERFRKAVSRFYADLAKGQECEVRHYLEEDRLIIAVVRGSYRRSVPEWKNSKVKTLFYRPAQEDILQFNMKTGVLSIKAPYKKDKDNYISRFADIILGDDTLADNPERDQTYTLKPLSDGTFDFGGDENIRSVKLLVVKYQIDDLDLTEVTIKSVNVLQSLKSGLGADNLRNMNIVHAKFLFVIDDGGKKRKVTCEITPPNMTDLNRKKYADIIGAYLRANGVKLV
jgi:hypothetical protein